MIGYTCELGEITMDLRIQHYSSFCNFDSPVPTVCFQFKMLEKI